MSIHFTDDAGVALSLAEPWLRSEPVLNNLVLTLLLARAQHSEPGRYWIAEEGGVVFQSPLDLSAVVTPMSAEVVNAMVDAIASAGVALPGVNGDALTAARFAGQWTERTKSAASPAEGLRMYEVCEVASAPAPGRFRRAEEGDRELLLDWMRGFKIDVDHAIGDVAQLVDRRLRHFWLWEDGAPVSCAAHTEPAGGVVRVQYVYTPRESRGRGYAAACTAALSARMLALGHRCMLYTALQNPTSNSIYRRIGYRAVAEGLRYRFNSFE